MEINIRDQPTTVELFASERTLKERLAFEKGGLPEYFVIRGKVVPEANIDYSNIMEDLAVVNQKVLPHIIERLSKKYNISKQTIILIWLLVIYKAEIPENITDVFLSKDYPKVLGDIYSGYLRVDDIIDSYKRYISEYNKQRELLQRKVEDAQKINTFIVDIEPQEYTKFTLTETKRQVTVDTEGSNTLINIFDGLNMSYNLPFAVAKYNGKSFYKISESITPQEDWLDVTPEDDEMIFYISEDSEEYIKGVWKKDNTIDLSLAKQTDEQHAQFLETLITSLSPRINVQVKSNLTKRVKGVYEMEGVKVNPYILADMITNDQIMGYFLFANETRNSLTQRSSYSVYYRPGGDFVKVKSPVITFGFREDSLVVKIAKLEDVDFIPQIQDVIARLITFYRTEEEALTNIYQEYGVSIVYKPNKIAEEKTIEGKSGRRLKNLKLKRPNLFKGSFSAVCQHESKQPYLVPSDEVESYKEWARKTTKSKDGSKYILNFPPGSDDWYGCLPREGEVFKDFYVETNYPSITINKRSDKAERPCYPCCTADPQKKVKINQCLGKGKGEKPTKRLGHILASIKLAVAGRFAQLPKLVRDLAIQSGIEEISEGRNSFLPLFRYGVTESSNSFLRCVICALNSNYISQGEEFRKKLVNDTKKEMIAFIEDNGVPNRGRQSLYDKSKKDILDTLRGGYINPKEFVGLFEEYFQVNIFLFAVTKKYPGGKMLIPRYSVAFLPPQNSYKKSIFVNVSYKSPRIAISHPSQSEVVLLYQPSSKNKFITSFGEGDEFVKKVREARLLSNTIKRVS